MSVLGVLVKHRRPTGKLDLRANQVRLLLRFGLSKPMGGTSIQQCVFTGSTKVPFPTNFIRTAFKDLIGSRRLVASGINSAAASVEGSS